MAVDTLHCVECNSAFSALDLPVELTLSHNLEEPLQEYPALVIYLASTPSPPLHSLGPYSATFVTQSQFECEPQYRVHLLLKKVEVDKILSL